MKEARTKFEQDYAPWTQMASVITPQEFQSVAPFIQALARNPEQAARMLAEQFGYELTRRGEQPAQPHASSEPQPDLQTADGRLLYSAEQAAKREAWLRQQMKAEWDKELKPFKDSQTQAQQAQFLKQIENKAYVQLKEAETWEGFTDLKPEIIKLMKADKRVTLHSAYQRAYRDHYMPTRDESLKKKWSDEQTARARGAATGGSPGTTVQGRTQGPITGSTREAFRRELAARLPEGVH